MRSLVLLVGPEGSGKGSFATMFLGKPFPSQLHKRGSWMFRQRSQPMNLADLGGGGSRVFAGARDIFFQASATGGACLG